MDVLDFFFPKRCIGCHKFCGYLCPDCFAQVTFVTGSVCAVCSRASLNSKTHPLCKRRYTIDGVLASVVYAGIIKRLIYQFKFQPYLHNVRTALGELFNEGIIQNETFFTVDKEGAYLVPVPLHPSKERKRGYNHAMLLAKELESSLKLPVVPLLIRQRKTLPQYGLSQKERKDNIKDAFALHEKGKKLVAGKTIFLVDDIVTSGATLQEAASTLKRAGAKEVWGLAFAHGE